MARGMGIKIILLLIVAALVAWNLYLHDKITIPYLSTLSPMIIWIIAGAVLVLEIIINLAGRKNRMYGNMGMGTMGMNRSPRGYNPYGY